MCVCLLYGADCFAGEIYSEMEKAGTLPMFIYVNRNTYKPTLLKWEYLH